MYRVESGINQVGYEISQHCFVCSRYTVKVGSPLGVLDNPRCVANQVDIDVLHTVGTQTGQISEQVGYAHALALQNEGIHYVGWQIDIIRILGYHVSVLPD